MTLMSDTDDRLSNQLGQAGSLPEALEIGKNRR